MAAGLTYTLARKNLTLKFPNVVLLLCRADVAHLQWPRASSDNNMEFSDEFSIITQRDVYENDENRFDLLTLMLRAVDEESDVSNDQNEIEPYFYDRPRIPFDDGTPAVTPQDFDDVNIVQDVIGVGNAEPTTERPKDEEGVSVPVPEKLEEFSGYVYVRPQRPMELPTVTTTTEATDEYVDLPGASARTTIVDEEGANVSTK